MESIKINEALNNETNNLSDIYLYRGKDNYWYSFENSAFFLTNFFPYVDSYIIEVGNDDTNSSINYGCSRIKLFNNMDDEHTNMLKIKSKIPYCENKYREWRGSLEIKS